MLQLHLVLPLVSAWDHGGCRVFSYCPQPSPAMASETVFTHSPHVHSPHEDRFLSCGWLGRVLCRHCLAVIRTQSSLRVASVREDWVLDVIRENFARAAVRGQSALGATCVTGTHTPHSLSWEGEGLISAWCSPEFSSMPTATGQGPLYLSPSPLGSPV